MAILKSSVTKGGAVKIEITEEGRKNIDELLALMPIELREKQLKQALRRAARPMINKARSLAPAPTEASEKDEKISLKDSIGVKIKAYSKAVCAFIGPRRPWGAHGHLIEFGFEQKYVRLVSSNIKVKRKQPKQIQRQPFMRPAAITTRDEQERELVKHLKRGIGKLA